MHQIRSIAIAAVMLIASCVAQAQWSWQGTWSGSTAYTANQVVYYLGSSYLCLVGNTNVAPPTNGTDWALIAQAGAAGAAGSPASVSIGSTYAGPPLSYPSVVNSGSGASAVLNFTIPASWAVGQGVISINGTAGTFTFNGTCFSLSGTVATFTCPAAARTQLTLPTTSISANTCTTTATVTLTGVGATSTFATAFAANPTAVNGWGANGGLVVQLWPDATTANTLDWSVCNQSGTSITPGAMTLNVAVL